MKFLKASVMYKDKDFIERKMKHYNQWMLDSSRDPNSRYPGFPEEIAFEFIQKEYVKDFLSRPKKGSVRNEKTICQPSKQVCDESNLSIPS